MTRVFVYEYVTAIGARGDEPLAPSLLAEGRAMRDAAIEDFAAITGIEVLTVACDDESSIRETARSADYALVIAPETDGILEERCRWALESGTLLLSPTLETIRLTSDKLTLAQHFARRGVPHPRTWPLGDQPNDLFPIVVKPRDGAGSQNTFTYSPRQAGGYMVQELINGIPASVAFLIGTNQHIALLPCRQHLSDDGRLRYLGGSLPLPDHLAKRALSLAEQAIISVPGLQGYVGVDLVLADNSTRDCVIEINPRLTTSYVGLRRAARFNIAEALLQVARGDCLPTLPWRPDFIAFHADGQCSCDPKRPFQLDEHSL